MESKVCTVCNVEKSLSEYYKKLNGVRLAECKRCKSNRSLKDYSQNRTKALKRMMKHWEKIKDSDSVKESRKKNYKNQLEKFPEKFKARSIMRNAIYRGDLKRLPCEVCGDKKSQGHHDDYSKPLEVRWLCFKHHRQLHNQLSALSPNEE